MEVFADSFYWIAALNTEDQYNFLVSSTPIDGLIVTSVAVQLEVIDAFSAVEKLRKVATFFWDLCNQSPTVHVVPLEMDLLLRAMTLFAHRSDKEWSLTDCISFEIMRERGIDQALTADNHFRQAGFSPIFLQD
jgi:uncharacterized protein